MNQLLGFLCIVAGLALLLLSGSSVSDGQLFRDGYRWVRLWNDGPGLKICDDRHPPLFSERNGFVKVLRLGRYRVRWLPRWKREAAR